MLNSQNLYHLLCFSLKKKILNVLFHKNVYFSQYLCVNTTCIRYNFSWPAVSAVSVPNLGHFAYPKQPAFFKATTKFKKRFCFLAFINVS